jgi:hypothetical protein
MIIFAIIVMIIVAEFSSLKLCQKLNNKANDDVL